MKETIRISQPLNSPSKATGLPPDLPAETSGIFFADCYRSSIPVTVGFTIDGQDLCQSGAVVVLDAVQAKLIPLTSNLNLVSIDNPAGSKLNYSGRVTTDNKIYSDFSKSVKEGEQQSRCLVKEVGIYGKTRRVRLEMGPVTALQQVSEAMAELVELDLANFRLVPEGDEQVKANANWLEDSPAPLAAGETVPTLGVSYQFDKGWKYLCVKPIDAKPLADKPTKLGIWVHGDNSNNLLRMRFIDSTNQVFQPDGGRLDFTGWRYIEFAMDGKSCGFWNGAKDGKIHYPIRIETLLLLDSAAKTTCEGKIYFAAPCLYYEAK